MNRIFILLMLIILVSCNHGSNKIITDEKTGKPMLIGSTDLSAFNYPEFSDWYDAEYSAYEPDDFIIEQLKSNLKNIDIEIFMGTWCGDSRREVPRFIKILDLIEYDKNKLQIINVDRNKRSPQKAEKNKTIEYVPTIIFLNNNVEIGRIIEYPIITLESDMLDILMGVSQ